MKTKFLAIFLLAIFAVSSLEGVWSYAGLNFYDFDKEAVDDVNEFDNEPVNVIEFDNETVDVDEATQFKNKFDQLDESDSFDDISEESNEGKHKHKHPCKKKSQYYTGARCVNTKCQLFCRYDGYKTGQCSKLEDEDKVKKCYCVKRGKYCKKHHHAHAPAPSPANAPGSSAPAPQHSSISPVESPENAPAPAGSKTLSFITSPALRALHPSVYASLPHGLV